MKLLMLVLLGALAGSGGRPGPDPGAAARSRAVFRRPGDLGRAAVARRPVPLVHQALQGHAQRVGQEGRRAVRGRQGADRRHQTPGDAVLLGRDSKYVLYVQDQGGDENYNVYAVDPSAAPAAGAGRPGRAQRHRRQGRARADLLVPKNEPGILYVGLNDRDKAWHDLYRLEIATGKRTLVRQNTEKIAGWVFDNAGTLRLARARPTLAAPRSCASTTRGSRRSTRAPSSRAAVRSGSTRTASASTSMTSKGEGRPVAADPVRPGHRQGRTRRIGPGEEGGLRRRRFLRRDRRTGRDDLPRRQAALVLPRQGLRSRLPAAREEAGRPDGQPRVAHRRRAAAGSSAATSDVEPGETFVFDRKTKQLTSQYTIREKLPRERPCRR